MQVNERAALRYPRVELPSSCRSISGNSQLRAELTIVTASGTFRVQTTDLFSLIYP